MDIPTLLRNHGFRATALRHELLLVLQNSDRALTHAELVERLDHDVDRVTVFRALNAFEEAGLVHRVLDNSGVGRFASCAGNCSAGHHKDAHAHFHCSACGSVFCLPTVELPKVRVPRGFKLHGAQLELEGRCKACA